MVDLPITKWIKKKIRRLIAIVEDTDVATHSIASGKYVVWKGDLYKSTAAIAVDGSLSLSNLSPVSDGGLNELSGHLAKSTLGDLLWSNSDNIGATTISIPNLYTYDEIRIVWADANSTNNIITYAKPIVGGSVILCAFDIDGSKDYSHAFNARSRVGDFVNDGISWGNGQMLYNGNVYKDWTNRAIPKQIYGIKYT